MTTSDDYDNNVPPAQIPLLDDVVFHTSLPLPVTPRRRRAEDHPQQPAPTTTDLFIKKHRSNKTRLPGTKPEVTNIDQAKPSDSAVADVKRQIDAQASSMIDTLVAEYSQEIVRRLRDELTALLDDLDNKKP